MKIEDFKKIDERFDDLISSEKFLYKDEKIEFYYRIVINWHSAKQEGWTEKYKTEYSFYFVVDEESIHEEKKKQHDYEISYIGLDLWFWDIYLKKYSRNGKFSEDILKELLQKLNEIKINPNRQKVKGILNGTNYSI